jgi:hypothetical protein
LLVDDGEPECFEEAMVLEHKDKWLEVMQDEMKSLHENNTIEFVKLLRDKNVSGEIQRSRGKTEVQSSISCEVI